MEKVKFLVKQQIHNHLHFHNVERFVEIIKADFDVEFAQLFIKYRIRYYKDELDVSNQFPVFSKPWVHTDHQFIAQRNLTDFSPVENPDFVAHYEQTGIDENGNVIFGETVINENDRYLTAPAFSYIVSILQENPALLFVLLQLYIGINAEDGLFDIE